MESEVTFESLQTAAKFTFLEVLGVVVAQVFRTLQAVFRRMTAI